MPRVSIITPVKLRAAEEASYLHDCAVSVLKQTIGDWEWVIVDDASQFPIRLPKDARVRLHHSKGTGVAAARNTAASLARAELIYPLDADDALEPTTLEKLLAAWTAGGQKEGIVYPSVLMFGGKDRDKLYRPAPYDFERLLRVTYILVGALHSKADWARVGGWKPALESGLEDWEYWIAMAEAGVCGYPAPEAVYRYRRNPIGRLARLKSDPTQWHLSYTKLHDLHKKAFEGEIMCCGRERPKSSKASSSSKGGGGESQATALIPGVEGMVPIEYQGSNVGKSVWIGEVTKLQYVFANSPRDKVKYVDSRDVDGFLRQIKNRNAQFALYVPPTPPAVVKAPEPEPVKVEPEPVKAEPEPVVAVVTEPDPDIEVVPEAAPTVEGVGVVAPVESGAETVAADAVTPEAIKETVTEAIVEAVAPTKKRGRKKKDV